MKSFLFFLLGAGLGFAAAYLGLKKHFEKVADERIDEEIGKINGEIKKIREWEQKKQKEAHPDITKDTVNDHEVREAERIISYNRYSKDKENRAPVDKNLLDPLKRENGAGASAPDTPAEDQTGNAPYDEDEDFEPDVDDFPHDPDEPVREPYLITESEFGERTDYSTETLYFYEDNGVLLDEKEMFVDNADRIIGEALSCFGDDDHIFVRNEYIMADYEIIRFEMAYEE